MTEIPIKLEMTASQKNGMLVLSFGDHHLLLNEEQARGLKDVLDSWLVGDKTKWGPKKPDDPNHPRGKPHKWEPLKFDKWPGDETGKELMDQLREVE